MRYFICLLLLVVSLLLAGCQPAASPAATTVSATMLPTSTSTDTRLALKPCIVADGAIKAECGTLRVPEDRTNSAGRVLDLGVIVVRARRANYEADPLFYITGGPGGIATDPDNVILANTVLWDVNATRDIIYLDQRGTNDKHRLTCDPIPDDVANGTQQQMNNWMNRCLSGLDGDPRFYTTAEAMRDLDGARAALGYDKINLYGGSYGVIAAQVYMRLFPERVRAAVLDHGTALDLPFIQLLPRVSQAALDQVFTYCEQDEKCRAAYPDIRGDWKAVLARLAKGPVVTSYTAPGATEPAEVSMDGLAGAVHNLMFKYGTYSQIPFIVHTLATSEDWTAVVKSYNEQYASDNSGEDNRLLLMKSIIFCFEPSWGELPDEIARLNPNSYYRDIQVKAAQTQQKICTALPNPAPSLIYGPGKPAPLSALMLNSLLDPQNPPSNMEPALKEFTQSRLVTEPTEGHETSASECRWGIVTQYIQQGSMDGLDTSCMDHQKPSFVIAK